MNGTTHARARARDVAASIAGRAPHVRGAAWAPHVRGAAWLAAFVPARVQRGRR
ncbi:hypothetical protein AB0K48_10445 [Nonomuraea sp. NPDC055795]